MRIKSFIFEPDMKDFIRIFFSLSAFLCMWSCSDGDIITFELEFDQQLERCGNVGIENFDSSEASYVLYDLKTDPGESLILLMPGSSTYDAILFPTESPYETSFGINGSSVRFNYRTYNMDPSGIICAEIPDSQVRVLRDYEAAGGTVNTYSEYVDDNGIRTVTVTIIVNDTSLEILNADVITFGTYTHSYPIPN